MIGRQSLAVLYLNLNTVLTYWIPRAELIFGATGATGGRVKILVSRVNFQKISQTP